MWNFPISKKLGHQSQPLIKHHSPSPPSGQDLEAAMVRLRSFAQRHAHLALRREPGVVTSGATWWMIHGEKPRINGDDGWV